VTSESEGVTVRCRWNST